MPGMWCIFGVWPVPFSQFPLQLHPGSIFLGPVSLHVPTLCWMFHQHLIPVPQAEIIVPLTLPFTTPNLLLPISPSFAIHSIVILSVTQIKTQGDHWSLLPICHWTMLSPVHSTLTTSPVTSPSSFMGTTAWIQPSSLPVSPFSGPSALFPQLLLLLLQVTHHTAARVIVPKGSLVTSFSCSKICNNLFVHSPNSFQGPPHPKSSTIQLLPHFHSYLLLQLLILIPTTASQNLIAVLSYYTSY